MNNHHLLLNVDEITFPISNGLIDDILIVNNFPKKM